MGNYAPHLEIAVIGDRYFRKLGIGRGKEQPFVTHAQALDGEITINETHSNAAVVWRKGTVNYEQVTLIDAGIDHRVTHHPGTESCSRIGDKGTVQVNTIGILALGRTGKARLHTSLKELQARGFLGRFDL